MTKSLTVLQKMAMYVQCIANIKDLIWSHHCGDYAESEGQVAGFQAKGLNCEHQTKVTVPLTESPLFIPQLLSSPSVPEPASSLCWEEAWEKDI